MSALGQSGPTWVDALLDWNWTWPIARTAMAGVFVVSSAQKALDFDSAKAEQAALGLRPGAVWAVLTIATQLVAAGFIVSGRFVWLGAGALGVFTALAAFMTEAFWAMPLGPQRTTAMNRFFNHVALIGGFVLMAMVAEHR